MSCYFHSQFMLKKYYFCKKSVHSFLGLSKPTDSPSLPPSISKCGLGLISNETPRVCNPNVIESSSLALLNSKPMKPRSPPLPPLSSSKKKGHAGRGFIDEMGGGVDGLMSCTESLGFESCDERRVDDDDDQKTNDYQHMEFCEEERDRWRRKRNEEKRSERNNKKFPPPLSSLNQNGQPCFYLKPVRKNGRLELTEVKIQRNEILSAVRENGRLKLHLISNDACSKINEEEEEENEETKQEEKEQEVHNLQEEEEEEEEEKKVEELWKYRVNGEGSRRCHELVMNHLNHDYHRHHHHHHHINEHHSLHMWRQPCVTTR